MGDKFENNSSMQLNIDGNKENIKNNTVIIQHDLQSKHSYEF